MAVQELHGTNHAPTEEATKVFDKEEESDRLPEEMDVDDSEVLLRKEQKKDSISIIDQLRMKLEKKSPLKILLCQLPTLPLVCPINEVDVQRLENEFVNGYRDSDRVLYITLYNNHKDSLAISNDIKDSWDDHWKAASNCFNARLLAYPN